VESVGQYQEIYEGAVNSPLDRHKQYIFVQCWREQLPFVVSAPLGGMRLEGVITIERDVEADRFG